MAQLGRLPFKLNDSWELCYSTTWNSSMDSHCSWNKVAIWNLVIANRLPALALLQEHCPTLFHSLPQLQSQAGKVGTREECFTSNNTPKLSPHTTHREPKDQDMTRTWMPESFQKWRVLHLRRSHVEASNHILSWMKKFQSPLIETCSTSISAN